ncbi:MAG: M48 family metalloprotease [Egibacteraceae bacterium]
MPVCPRTVALLLAHSAAALVVAAGLAAQVVRPLAPVVGPMPPAGDFFDAAYVATAHAYRTPVYAVGLLAIVVRLAVAGWAAWSAPGRRLVDRVVDCVGAQRSARAAAAVVLAVVVATDIVLLPLTFWQGFVHEGAFGLRTQGLRGWSYDWLVARGPSWLAVGVVVLAGYALARRLPRAWPAVGGVGLAVLGVVVAFVAPLVLEPLEFNLQPLPEGPVRAEVETILARAGETGTAILVADASRRTTRQNAYVSGLGSTRRVVLYDTLVEARPPAEVGLVLAHELGHDRHRDVPRLVLLGGAGTVVGAYVVAWMLRRGARRDQDGPTDPRAAAAVLAVTLLLSGPALPVQQLVSRRAEAAADLASLDLTRDAATYQAMQVALTRSNLAEPLPPAWATALWGSHPPSLARLAMGLRWTYE